MDSYTNETGLGKERVEVIIDDGNEEDKYDDDDEIDLTQERSGEGMYGDDFDNTEGFENASYDSSRRSPMRYKFHSKNRRRPSESLVFEFFSNGQSGWGEKQRDALLEEAQTVIPDTDRHEHTFGNRRKASIQGFMQHRDLRFFVYSDLHTFNHPAILVRRHAVVVNLKPIKALVLYDRCLILAPDWTNDDFRRTLENLRDLALMTLDLNAPFEVRAMEAIFLTVSDIYEEKYDNLRPEVEKTLEEVLHTPSGGALERLRQVRDRTQKLLSKINALQEAFHEIMQSDEDMALMLLSNVHSDPGWYSESNRENWIQDHLEIELLLENYELSIDRIGSLVRRLENQIISASDSVTLRLDQARNTLLRFEVMLAGVTSAAGVGALVAAAFGMNLNSGVENAETWFWGIAGFLFVGTFVASVAMISCVYHRRWLITF